MTPLSQQEHLEKAALNEVFFKASFGLHLQNNSSFLDWATTVIFYSALHYIDALLNHIGKEANDHIHRRKFITIEPKLRAIEIDYKWLYDRSRDARYGKLGNSVNRNNVLNWKNGQLKKIKDHVLKQMDKP